jgi:hypothetical protein
MFRTMNGPLHPEVSRKALKVQPGQTMSIPGPAAVQAVTEVIAPLPPTTEVQTQDTIPAGVLLLPPVEVTVPPGKVILHHPAVREVITTPVAATPHPVAAAVIQEEALPAEEALPEVAAAVEAEVVAKATVAEDNPQMSFLKNFPAGDNKSFCS